MNHPNATYGGGSALVGGYLLVSLLDRFGVHLAPQDGAAIAGSIGIVVLWVGKRGIKSAILSLWKGSGA